VEAISVCLRDVLDCSGSHATKVNTRMEVIVLVVELVSQ
jgi:hypothetical protein